MKMYVKLSILLLLIVIGLIACSGKNNKEDDKSDSSNEATIPPKDLPDAFLAGDFEKIYNQTSEGFQSQLTLKGFVQTTEAFHKDIRNYSLVSTMPLQGMSEYLWRNTKGNKGLRGIFAEDHTIEGLQVMPLTSNKDTDNQYTENTYQLPMEGEWLVFWGGTNELVNYHYATVSQRYAYDLVIQQEGTTFKGDPTKNKNYHAFGKKAVAPFDGVIVSSENTIPDNTPTIDTNTEQPLGNHVVIEHENNEYSFIAHLQEGSLMVQEGDEVFSGEVVGLVGNSGNSSEPHIHYHVADNEELQEATSIRIRLTQDREPIRGDMTEGFNLE
ncbi:M23 family metallopeptidase [Virgibacillus salexigens]|uniref:M23 family metallopeptidase n=1 Tax=Virgibacillus salexigens TaxID=61016 RepID=UPI00190A5FCA|nr:M23 family metallopeptidase [Virgibacillus salexigens]